MLSENAIEVLKKRYLLRNEKGELIETPMHLFRRVAKIGGKDKEEEFFQMMKNLEFLPNSPTLMNAGTKLGQLSACFVLPVDDSIESIFSALKNMAKIHQSGGGTGFDFSKIRPKGERVMSTKGKASGPVSFIRIFDTATEVIKQGGKRRGANMAILEVSHPDIIEFVIAKRYGLFNNFNVSVAVTDKFMKKVEKDEDFNLRNPKTGKTVKKIKAKALFDLIAELGWETGDPGMVFIDEINRKNVMIKLGRINATNPCGEVPLFPYESCNLGSINLSKFVENKKINWKKLAEATRLGVKFLDNILDVNKFPMPEIKKATLANRKIGLGVMGFADMLIKMNIKYDSEKAVNLAELVMRFIAKEARQRSIELGKEKGNFPNFKKSKFYEKYNSMRNATVTTIAPTGSISIISGCSSGIEPLFGVCYVKKVIGDKFIQVNPVFEKIAKERKFYSNTLIAKILKKGSIQDIEGIPDDVKRIFVTAHDIKPEWHVKIQAAFQKYTDNAVSKTVNLKATATKNDIKKIYMLAYKSGCKGITVYRDKSKKEQVLDIACSAGVCHI